MPNYNEVTGTGTMWTRCRQVVIENPFGGLKKPIRFSEENVVNIDNNIFTTQKGQFEIFFDSAKVIQLRDPVTNTMTGTTFTHQDLYNMLHSLYIQSAVERDAQ